VASEVKPVPLASRILRGRREACQATPEPPRLLVPRAARVPATWVPWELSSEAFGVPETKFQPRTSSM
jgi:hypothetical protein